MQEIMLSVAVITYNQEEYIAQTLDSILNQEHDYRYEIVIGEDCSTDNTKKIIEEYVSQYPEIIKPLYNNPNKGVINNYFNVINHCQGKYIMECAGDDYWLPGKVKTQIAYMENHPDVGMCYSDVRELLNREWKSITSKGFVDFDDLILENCIPALSVCLRRTLLEEYRKVIKPQGKNWLMEDYPIWLWFSIYSNIQYLPFELGVYRIQENSLSHSIAIEKQVAFMKSTIDIRNYYLALQGKKIVNFDENRLGFNLTFSKILYNYTNENVEKCLCYGRKIQSTTKTEKIKMFMLRYKILFGIYKLINMR